MPDESQEYEEVTPENCYNSSNIGFNLIYTSQELTANGKTNAAARIGPAVPLGALLAALFAGLMVL